jgi:hypothetical protein
MKYPSWSTRQVVKMVSKMWARMSRSQKEHYKKLSDSDRQRFDSERKALRGEMDETILNAQVYSENPVANNEE